MTGTELHRRVRVIYRADPNGGWTYTVFPAEGPVFVLGEGWSAGKKKDAEDAFRMAARGNRWIDEATRTERMKGAA